MTTIPASELVSVNPSVIGAGGDALAITGLFLTTSTRAPLGTVQSFPDQASVSDYFGAGSTEDTAAGIYFSGFTGADARPASLLLAQYNTAAVGAYLRGGDISGLTLAQLQALTPGTLSVTIDTVVKSGSINLSAATSFSNAASIIGNTLSIQGPQDGVFTGAISGTTLTISAVTSGTIGVGDVISGSGVTAGTYITALGTGTGGVGTYTVSASQTAGSTTITAYLPAVTYDSVSGAFEIVSTSTGTGSTITYGSGAMATSLLLTAATGAVLSQGAAIAVPATFMNALIAVNQNWVTFTHLFNPDASGNTNKLAFAAWKDTKNNRYAYVCWDSDTTPTTTNPATTSVGYILDGNNDSGTCVIWATDYTIAAFICGAAASIDFAEPNGRITFAYKSQAGILANVTDSAVAADLLANHYNFYGAYGAANESFVWFQNGTCTGPFTWFDAYINQVWLNNLFQVSLLNLLGNAKSIPFSAAGNSLIEQSLADPIASGLSFGAYGPGEISAAQAAEVNADAGANIAGTLQTQGYYLQILAATSSVRAARGPRQGKFFYLDRGSVQTIELSSVAVL